MAESNDFHADNDRVGSGFEDGTVLSTKFHVPRRPQSFVSRPRLTERLDGVGPGAVAVVSAPAGCGKSVLVSDWCDRVGYEVAWLSLDARDNDPIRFWRHITSSLERSGSDESSSIGADVDQLIRRSGDPSLDQIATAVLNGIDDGFDDVVLVLDDYHIIEHGDVHAGVELLLERAPEQLRVVVITRVDPPLSLARRRARGELTEIREAELRFNPDEATDFLNEATTEQLPEEAISTLTERTEGWAVGLQLAALSLQGRDDVPTFLATFSGSHRFVLDYLAEEVLDRQPAPVADFLLSTSVLSRLSGPLCDAATGGTDGQAMLEACERTNLFLVPLDDDRRWWRYHHLFAELLRLRLHQRFPERVPEVHRRAAGWYEQNGFIDQAIEHAIAAGDVDQAVRLIETHSDEFLFRREGATLRRHLASLPTRESRRLLLAQARTAAYEGRLAKADSLIDAAATTAAEPSSSFEPSVDRMVSPLAQLDQMTALIEAFVAHLRGEVDAVSDVASETLAGPVDNDSTIGLIAQWYLGVGPWLRGAVEEAELSLIANVDGWQALGDPGRGALTSHRLGQVQRSRGDLDRAVATYERALSMSTTGTGSLLPASAVPHVGLAEIAYQRGDLDTAQRLLETGIVQGRQFVFTQPLSNGLATLAWLRRATGDHNGAVEAMDEAVEAGPDPDVVDLLNPVPVQRAQLLLAAGDERPAERWIKHRGVTASDEPRYAVEPAQLLLARLMIHRSQGAQVLPLLDRLLSAATQDGRTGIVIEIEVLRALALAADDPDNASSALRRAVTLAAPQRHVRVFVDEGPPMISLLGTVVAALPTTEEHRAVLDHVALLIRDLGGTARNGARPGQVRQPLVVPLTERELEVLSKLAVGHSNREIADELYVSLNTVKKHVTHILEKLGATNRTAAVDRARALELLH